MNTTTIAPENLSPAELRLWLALVEDKLAGDYDSGQLHRLVIDCDIDPRLTGQSAEAFASYVNETLHCGQLAGLIDGGHIADIDQATPAEVQLYGLSLEDERLIARARKDKAEYIKGHVVDPIANMIIGEVSHLAPHERRGRIEVILAELREGIKV